MGMLLNLSKGNGLYGEHTKTTHNGINLTPTGFGALRLSRRKKAYSNKCSICRKNCSQSLGDRYERICINCIDEFVDNSIVELDYIKEKLIEEKKFLNDNRDKITKKEKEIVDIWDKEDMLNKLENEE